MGKLISVSVYTKDSTQYSPSIQAGIQEDSIVICQPATTAQKQSFPSASANINTWLKTNAEDENAGISHGYLVGESVNTIINGS